MSVLVLDGALLAEALVDAGDEDVIVVDTSAARLEELEREVRDPRAFFLIGDAAILPLPDGSVDAAIGIGVEPELHRVLRG
jgi:ubiquinone/menaquinone biosynthesis C-methylase UbiE